VAPFQYGGGAIWESRSWRSLDAPGLAHAEQGESNIMAHIDKTATLMRLSDTDLTVADPAEDVRSRTVFDRDGEEIGDINDLLIDDHEKRVRFLEVASGGFLGLGQTKFLIPVDAITRVREKEVVIDQSRQHIVDAPRYDPNLMHQDVGEGSYYGDVYRHYGYPPFWGPGYMYPPYPYYPYV
jgi:sporulation protein YlmC with PRC-barrel domain